MVVITQPVTERNAAARGPSARPRFRSRQRLAQWLFLAPAAVYLLLFFGFPIVKNIAMGFQHYTTTSFYTGEAPFVGLTNYAKVLASDLFSTELVNTVLFSAGAVLGQFLIGLGLALFFRRRFPLNRILRSLLLLPWLWPPVVPGATWRWVLDADNGVLNHALGSVGLPSTIPWLTSTSVAPVAVILVNIWVSIPFTTTILYGGLQEIPLELYEAARLDGAGPVQAFRRITWPLLRPAVSVVLVLSVIYTLRTVDVILVLTNGGPANATQTIATQSYQLSFQQFDFGQGAAMGNLLIAISLIFALVYLRATRRAQTA